MPSRKDLAKIHIAKKELGLTDDEYRDILRAHFRKDSAAKLTPVQAGRLLNHFKKLGWKPRQRTLPGMTLAADPMSKKIRALWLTLADSGVIHNRSEKAMLAFVKRQTGRNRLEWCTVQDKDKVIEALKDWAKREGVKVAG